MSNISLSNIVFAYPGGKDLFNNLCCSITDGAHIAIIGDNGVGKTTLLQIISGALIPDGGRVVLNGKSITLNQFNVTPQKSGGQAQMAAIANVFDSGADVLLLDEPTNNLDDMARRVFYNKLRKYPGTVVVVSHDRHLLNQMDALLELHDGQISVFGGNYDFYVQQKDIQRRALESRYTNSQKNIARLTQTKMMAQSMRHNHEAKQAKDKANSASGSPIVSNSLKGKSQETEAKRRKIIDKKLNKEIEVVQNLSNQMRDDKIKIPLASNNVYNKDIVLIENMSFGYTENQTLFDNFSLRIRGGDKIQLVGINGSGKTTLIQLICGILKPNSGSIKTTGKIACLNQNLSILDKNKTIVENISEFADIKIHDAHAVAANFGFRGDMAKRMLGTLSGGELLKATLAAVIGSKNQPDLLILDEPTNNLDIKSTIILEDALREYRGTILLVSHDDIFVKNIGIENVINLV